MIAVLFAAASIAAAPGALVVKEYLRDSMHEMKEDGTYKGLTPKSSLPKTPVQAMMTPKKLIKIGSGPTALYFRQAEVLTEGGGGARCTQLAAVSTEKGRRLAASDLGAGNGLSTTSSACIPVGR